MKDFEIKDGKLVRYSGADAHVTVPDGVTCIGERVFYKNETLESVILPQGLKSIGNEAFFGCRRLRSIQLPENVSFHYKPFKGCEGLADEKGFVILQGTLCDYYGKDENVSVPQGVTTIDSSAFQGCESVVRVVLPEGVVEIDSDAFAACFNLAEVVFPETLNIIGWNAFWRCERLRRVTLREGLLRLDHGAFTKCNGLTDVVIPKDIEWIGDNVFSECANLTSVTVSEGVKKIPEGMFRDCRKLASVSLPESLSAIGEAAFSGCVSLTDFRLPESVEFLGYESFHGCKGLADENGFVVFRNVLFSYVGTADDVRIPDGVRYIDEYAFKYGKISRVTIPEGVERIQNRAFYCCENLTEISFPGSLREIRSGAFSGCRSLKYLTLPEGLLDVYDEALGECKNLTGVILPESTRSICELPFRGYEYITMPPIGVFKGSDNLQWVKVPMPLRDSVHTKNMSYGVVGVTKTAVWPYAYSANEKSSNYEDYYVKTDWASYDAELVNNGPVYTYKHSARLLGALGRLMAPFGLTEENRAWYLSFLTGNAAEVIALAEAMACPELVRAMYTCGVINGENREPLQKLLAASSVPGFKELAAEEVRS